MTEQQFGEYLLMQAAAGFLKEQGLSLHITDERDPNAPIDYRGTLDGTPWAFELTQLRIKDPQKARIGRSHTQRRKSP